MAFFGVRLRFKTVLGSTHVVEQLLISFIPLILIFDFDLILVVLFLLFGALMGYFWGPSRVQNCFMVYSCS